MQYHDLARRYITPWRQTDECTASVIQSLASLEVAVQVSGRSGDERTALRGCENNGIKK